MQPVIHTVAGKIKLDEDGGRGEKTRREEKRERKKESHLCAEVGKKRKKL